MTVTDFFSNTYIQTLVLAAITGTVSYLFASRPRVVWSKTHQSFFELKPRESWSEGNKTVAIQTSEIWLKNSGRSPAKNIEVVLNYAPEHFQVWTPRRYQREILSDERLSLTFDTLGPGDELEISMLDSYGDTPNVIEVRHETGLAKEVEMQTTIRPGSFTLIALGTLIVGGIIMLLYQVASILGPMILPPT